MSSCVSGTLNVKLQGVLGRRMVLKTLILAWNWNNSYLARLTLLTLSRALVYERTTNCSISCNMESGIPSREWDLKQNASVTEENLLQTSQACFLPLPKNAETLLQPVIAWNPNNASHFSAPSLLTIVWIGMKRLAFPVGKVIQSSSIHQWD